MLKKQWNNQNGFALPMVLLIFSVSFILATSVFIFTHSQIKQEVDYGKDMEAMHIAEAGLHYALEYLNNSDPGKDPSDIQGYIIHYFDDGLFIKGVVYQIADDGSMNGDIAGHYVLKLSAEGSGFTVRSTGWTAAGEDNNRRTVEANINKKRFTDYLYFFNITHPVPDGAYINGPYHSNEDLFVAGSATFTSAVTYVTGEFEIVEALHDFQAGPPRRISKISFPQSPLGNLESLAEAVYSGDTRIFLWENSMNVSREEQPGEENGDEEDEEDGDDSIWVTESVPLPFNGVIYVDGDVYVSGEASRGVTIAASGSIIISPVDPIEDAIPVDEKVPVPWIGCTEGILGLIAGNQVRTTTVWYDGDPIPMNPDGIRIEAAVFAFSTGFLNEGVSTFTGSITQNQNYLVSPGFTVNYSHSSLIPPHFIEPEDTRYEIISWTETNVHNSFD